MIDIKKHSLYKPMEVDSVLTNIFSIYLKKFIILFIFSFIAVFMIQMILFRLGFMEMSGLTDPEEILKVFSKLIKKLGIVSVASVVFYGFLNTFLISYIIKSDLDPKVHIGDLLVESIRKYAVHMIFFLILSLIIVVAGAFVGVIAIVIGSLIAMIYLGTVLMVGGTIIVVEEKNALDTIGRCFTLVHKDFWATLGSVVLFALIILLISFVMSAILAIPFLIMFFDNFNETGNILEALNFQKYDLGIWTVVLNSIVSAIVYPLYAILSVVLYFKLRYTEDHKEQSVTS